MQSDDPPRPSSSAAVASTTLATLVTLSVCGILCRLMLQQDDPELLVFKEHYLGVIHLFFCRVSQWSFVLSVVLCFMELCLMLASPPNGMKALFPAYVFGFALVTSFVHDSIYTHALFTNYFSVEKTGHLPNGVGTQYLITDSIVRYWTLLVVLPYLLMEYTYRWKASATCGRVSSATRQALPSAI